VRDVASFFSRRLYQLCYWIFMPWLVFLVTTAIAIAGLVAYIRLGKKVWQTDYILSQPYRWPDGLFCLVLGIYFLTLVASSSENSRLLKLEDIQTGTIFYILLDLIILSFLIIRRIHPIQLFGIRTLPWPRILKMTTFWLIALYPLIFLVQILVENIGGLGITPQPLVQFLIENPRLSDRITVGLLAVVVAPFTEELIFRGYLYGVMRKYAGRLAAIFVSSCLFAGIHQHLSAFPGLFLLAVALCLVYEATGCLLVSILMHAFFNLIGVLAAIFGPTVQF
jgi:membrane protease YdiL (CAAX protease family)